jgi:hypothetical protein
MSKHMLSKKSVRPFATAGSARMSVEPLEGRQMMSVTPSTLPNGAANDTVFDVDTDTLHVIYYDTATKGLKYQSFGTDGSKSAVETIDASGDTGQYLSLTEDANGVLHAAYDDVMNGDLKYARRDLAGVWSTSTVDSKNTVGLYPSVVIDADGLPAISYYFKNTGDLKFAKFNGSTWSTSMIATNDDIGRYPSLALNPTTNKLAVGFEDTTLGHFMYAEQNGGACHMTTVDSATQNGGGYISLNFNTGLPAMSYYDAFNADLKYAERSSKGKWNAVTVAAKNSQGLYTDLAFTFDTTQPAIVYYNKTQDSVFLGYRETNGVWNFETLLSGGGRNVTPADGSAPNGVAPALYLVYSDTATGGLKLGQF